MGVLPSRRQGDSVVAKDDCPRWDDCPTANPRSRLRRRADLHQTDAEKAGHRRTDAAMELPADRDVVLVVRDPQRVTWQQPMLAAAAGRPGTVVVDCGWPAEIARVPVVRTRGIARGLLALAAFGVFVGVIAVALSHRGLTGTISHDVAMPASP